MAQMNIGDIQDEHYRYKMPKLMTKIEGKGNGIKTVITNMVDIATALNRSPDLPTKYFGTELGALSKFDTKLEKAIVNGKHEQDTLIRLLNSFIKKFVLCGKCGNPETTFRVTKSNIYMDCKACGHTTTVPSTEKLTTYILKHPPQSTGARGTSAEADTSNANGDMPAVENLNIDDDKSGDDDEGESPSIYLRQFLDMRADATDLQIAKEIQRLTAEFRLKEKEVICMLCETFLLPKPDEAAKQITSRAPFFKKLTSEECQKIILRYFELICASSSAISKTAPQLLKALYDTDILDEETIIAWYDSTKKSKMVDKKTSKQIKEASKVFVEWLKTAEEDDDEED